MNLRFVGCHEMFETHPIKQQHNFVSTYRRVRFQWLLNQLDRLENVFFVESELEINVDQWFEAFKQQFI